MLPPRTLTALLAVHDRLSRAGLSVLVVGGCARALDRASRGEPSERPADVDLELAAAELPAAAALLGVAAATDVDQRVSSLRAHATIVGIAVDLSADLTVFGPGGTLPPAWDMQWDRRRALIVAGREIALAPSGEAVARALAAGDRAAAARARARAHAPDEAYVAARLAAVSSSASA